MRWHPACTDPLLERSKTIKRSFSAQKKGRLLTVCIAASGNIRPGAPPLVIVAADRMITIGDIEYEPDQTKSVLLAGQTVALLAGEMETHAVVCPAVQDSLTTNPPPDFLNKTIAERYATEFAFYRRYVAEQEILMPLGLTADDFLTRQTAMSHEFVRDVANKLLGHSIDSQAIIAGVDHTGPHIFKIVDPGVAKSFDTPCFAAIGTGSPHAESYLMTTGFHKNFRPSQILYAVFAAKMKAEIASGVGSQTDLLIIRGGTTNPLVRGGTFIVGATQMQRLRSIYEKQQTLVRQSEMDAIEEMEALMTEIADKSHQSDHAAQAANVPTPPDNTPPAAPEPSGDSGR